MEEVSNGEFLAEGFVGVRDDITGQMGLFWAQIKTPFFCANFEIGSHNLFGYVNNVVHREGLYGYCDHFGEIIWTKTRKKV